MRSFSKAPVVIAALVGMAIAHMLFEVVLSLEGLLLSISGADLTWVAVGPMRSLMSQEGVTAAVSSAALGQLALPRFVRSSLRMSEDIVGTSKEMLAF